MAFLSTFSMDCTHHYAIPDKAIKKLIEKEKESKEEAQRSKDRIEKARKAAEEYNEAQMQLLKEHEEMTAERIARTSWRIQFDNV